MIKEAIIKLSKKQDLAYAEAEAVMDEIMSGQASYCISFKRRDN